MININTTVLLLALCIAATVPMLCFSTREVTATPVAKVGFDNIVNSGSLNSGTCISAHGMAVQSTTPATTECEQ